MHIEMGTGVECFKPGGGSGGVYFSVVGGGGGVGGEVVVGCAGDVELVVGLAFCFIGKSLISIGSSLKFR